MGMRVHASPQWWWRFLIAAAGAAVLSWILLSGLVLHFVLAGGANPLPGVLAGDPGDVSSFLLHYVLPAMVLVDWLAFRPYGQARWRDLLGWMLFPLSYAAIVLARGSLVTGRYPYPFLNPDRQGWPGVGAWVGALTVGFALVGALLIAVDRLRRPRMPTQGY